LSAAPEQIEGSESGGGVPVRFSTATQRADRRWHRALVLGLLGAVLVHVIAVLLVRGTVIPPQSPFAAAGPNAGDIRASEAGGSGLTMVEVRVEQPVEEEVVQEVVPVPERIVVVETPRPTPTPPAATVTPPSQPGTGGAGSGGDAGETVGTGAASGDGRGGGGTGDAGASGLVAPVPRGMILPPPDRPRSVRGQEVTVWVFVTDRGRVAADSTRLEPPTPDARYNERLRRSAAEWIFEPARREGRAVGAWYPFEIIL
jgi:hypothetical protein